MRAKDFSYNDKNLSDFGMVLCRFDSGGLETVSGTEITFNTAHTLNGSKFELVNTQYENCLEATFQICKHPCNSNTQHITISEYSEIAKWLGRKKFLKLKFFGEDLTGLYYEAAFTNISRIELDGKIYGLELTVITNAPYAKKDPQIITIKNTEKDGKHSVNDISQEEGFIYPYIEITVNQDGLLDIHNLLENRHTSIKNVTAGEVIIMDYPIIQSSLSTHKIQNDFNWNFFRIANTYEKSRNDLIISLPCTIKLKYSPIVKVGL